MLVKGNLHLVQDLVLGAEKCLAYWQPDLHCSKAWDACLLKPGLLTFSAQKGLPLHSCEQFVMVQGPFQASRRPQPQALATVPGAFR